MESLTGFGGGVYRVMVTEKNFFHQPSTEKKNVFLPPQKF